ncbi:unnamed protein product [Anisakis simplex]|uniref:Uncharacterized protein n=1 Tax=Anisakis simplex TaxID=6269 RepID=A0A3P6P7U8_ANISI|nr:unnamed protein product [Anisakis simplex]
MYTKLLCGILIAALLDTVWRNFVPFYLAGIQHPYVDERAAIQEYTLIGSIVLANLMMALDVPPNVQFTIYYEVHDSERQQNNATALHRYHSSDKHLFALSNN